MTDDDIIKLAREVGAPVGVMALVRHDGVLFTPYELEHFVALVAAAERERIESEGVSMYEKTGDIKDINTIMIQRSAIRARGQS